MVSWEKERKDVIISSVWTRGKPRNQPTPKSRFISVLYCLAFHMRRQTSWLYHGKIFHSLCSPLKTKYSHALPATMIISCENLLTRSFFLYFFVDFSHRVGWVRTTLKIIRKDVNKHLRFIFSLRFSLSYYKLKLLDFQFSRRRYVIKFHVSMKDSTRDLRIESA